MAIQIRIGTGQGLARRLLNMARIYYQNDDGDYIRDGDDAYMTGEPEDCEDCCEDDPPPCEADTPEEVAQYIVDNAWQAQLVVTSDDYSDSCASGDCGPLAGTYTLPYHSTTTFATVGRTVIFRDTFSLTICDATRSIIAEVQVNIGVLGSDLNVSAGGYLGDASNAWVDTIWEDTIGLLTCQEIIEITNQALQALTPAASGAECKTATGVSGDAILSLIP